MKGSLYYGAEVINNHCCEDATRPRNGAAALM